MTQLCHSEDCEACRRGGSNLYTAEPLWWSTLDEHGVSHGWVRATPVACGCGQLTTRWVAVTVMVWGGPKERITAERVPECGLCAHRKQLERLRQSSNADARAWAALWDLPPASAVP
jgi:hypothetical protein